MAKVQVLGMALVLVFTYAPMLSAKLDERKEKKQKADEEAA